MTREIDADSLEEIAKREGLRLTAYKDTGGTWTVGYGHTDGVKQGDTIDQAQALAYLKADVVTAEDCVSDAIKVPLTDNQYGALVSFAFNIGCAAFCKSTLVKNLNKNDYAGVPQQMLLWVKVNGVTDPGLVNRRNSEGGQWVKNSYVRGASIQPDQPPPLWRRVWATGHAKVKAIGASIAGVGVTGAQIKDAGTQLQGYAANWHMLAYVGIGICVLGILMEMFHKQES